MNACTFPSVRNAHALLEGEEGALVRVGKDILVRAAIIGVAGVLLGAPLPVSIRVAIGGSLAIEAAVLWDLHRCRQRHIVG